MPEHPNIIKFYSKYEDKKKNIIYLVMQFLEGKDLQTWLIINEAKSRDVDQVVGFFLQMVAAVLNLA